MKLNLGAADRHIPEYLSVDIAPPADVVTDLSQRWPWDDSTVEDVKAFDIIEHLPDRIFTMNELHRVLKPGARAHIEVPDALRGAGFIQDPTHKTPWCLNSFQYFEADTFAHERLAKSYGITAKFKVVELYERQYRDKYEEVWKITAILEAVK